MQNPPGADFKYQRQYPTGDLYADISGYYTFAFGSTQLERTQNDVLAGTTPEQQLRALPGLITGGGDNSGSVQHDASATTCSRSPRTRSAIARGRWS